MDMDGTLLDDTQQIPEENLQALREASSAGIHIAICSGRSAKDVSYFASDAGLTQCHIIALNGCACMDTPHGAPYAMHMFPASVVEQVIPIFLKHDVTFAAFQAERIIVRESNLHVRKRNWGTHIARGAVNQYAFGIDALTQCKDEGICKFVYIDEDHSPRIALLRKELQLVAGLEVTSSWSNNLELIPQGVNKGTALKQLADRLGIARDDVMALGDYDNDLDMIAYAGYGVAMGNASQSVQLAARYTTLSNTQYGVAHAIRKYALGQSGTNTH